MKRLTILLALCLAACSHARVQTTTVSPTLPLPPPSLVAVTDFAITPDQVRLDSGVAAQLRRQQSGEPASATQARIAAATQAALAETLTKRLAGYGLPAERVPAGSPQPPGTLVVAGEILSVDQGNRTRRLLIGLGAGKSSMEVDAQVYYVGADGQQRLVQSATGQVDSGHMPGAAETLGAGAAAQTLGTSAALTVASHASGEMNRTGEQALADQLAAEVARRVGHFAAAQGWIPDSAVH